MKTHWKYCQKGVWVKGQLIVWCPVAGSAILQIAGIQSKLFDNPADAIIYGNTVEVLG